MEKVETELVEEITFEERKVLLRRKCQQEFLTLHRPPSNFNSCWNKNCVEVQDDTRKFKKCGYCKKSRYCSRTCQKIHWKLHKHDCFPQRAIGHVIRSNDKGEIYAELLKEEPPKKKRSNRMIKRDK